MGRAHRNRNGDNQRNDMKSANFVLTRDGKNKLLERLAVASTPDVAKQFGVGPRTITHWLAGRPVRDRAKVSQLLGEDALTWVDRCP